ncbi:MAG: hypothetical protein IJB59_06720 [Oscillospiraceae bacterium]|nr:hypothetical protein [Oscillospiraceae bacterium]
MKQTWKRYRLTVLILVLALAAGSMIGSAAAKYIYSTQLKATVTFKAELAEKIELLEHEAVSTEKDDKPTSNYKLTDETVTANKYELMPGVDIPKDPFVRITNKSPIPAYLYIEVVDTTPVIIVDGVEKHIISYTMGEAWQELTGDGIVGKNGGKLYYYAPNNEPKLSGTGDMEIYLLKGDKDAVVTVSDTYLANADTDDKLIFYAYLYEAYQIDDNGPPVMPSPARFTTKITSPPPKERSPGNEEA